MGTTNPDVAYGLTLFKKFAPSDTAVRGSAVFPKILIDILKYL